MGGWRGARPSRRCWHRRRLPPWTPTIPCIRRLAANPRQWLQASRSGLGHTGRWFSTAPRGPAQTRVRAATRRTGAAGRQGVGGHGVCHPIENFFKKIQSKSFESQGKRGMEPLRGVWWGGLSWQDLGRPSVLGVAHIRLCSCVESETIAFTSYEW